MLNAVAVAGVACGLSADVGVITNIFQLVVGGVSLARNYNTNNGSK